MKITRKFSLGLLLAVGTLLSAVAIGPPAEAAPQAPTCVRGTRGCECTVRQGPRGPELYCRLVGGTGGGGQPPSGGGSGSSGGTSTPTAYWRSRPLVTGTDAWGCFIDFGQPTQQGGRVYVFELISAATGQVLTANDECVPTGEAPDPAAYGFAAPPTTAEMLGATNLPQTSVGRNPTGRGSAGLESWFWAEGGTSVSVDVTLQGWAVTGTLHAVRWDWDVAGSAYTATAPGSEAAPAVDHTFEQKGTKAVAVEILWEGDYTVTGHGISFTVPGLAATSSTGFDYPVIEIEATVDEPGLP